MAGLLAVVLAGASLSARQEPAPFADQAGPGFARVLEGDAIPDLIISPNSGSAVSRVLDGATLADLGSGFPFGPGFGGGVRMAVGDLTGDGVSDIVAAMGPGGGQVILLNGVDASLIGGGAPFGAFGGGVNVAVGHFDGDGRLDIVTAQASGGGGVTVFNGVTYAPLFSLQPFGGGYTGGVNVATGDIDADGVADLVVGQASGGLVSIVNGATRTVTLSGVPFGGGGVWVAAGDVNGDGRADVVAGAGTGPGAVLVYDVHALAPITSFVAYGAGYIGGVRLAATDLTGDGRVEIITVPGPGGEPVMKIYDGATFANTNSLLVYPASFTNGVFVAAPAALPGIRITSAASATFTAGTAGTFVVQVAGVPVATSITQTGALPAGVTFTNNGNGTATLDGTPAAGTGGTYPITITANNGVSAPVTQSFTLTVQQAPAITSAATTTFSIGGAASFTVTTTGFPAPTLSLTGAMPAGVTFTPNSNGTATLGGTPAPGSSGDYPLTITATNGVGSASAQSFVLTVDTSAAFTSAAATNFVVGVGGLFTITTTGTPAVTSIPQTGTLPSGVTFTDNGNGTATLSGTPAAGAGGVYPLTFTASNGVGAPAQQAFTLTVQQAPALTSAATISFAVGAAGTFTITATGFPTPALSATGALPSGVTYTDNGDGTATLAGTPSAGTGAAYPLTVTAANGVGTAAQQTVTLSVNQPPAVTSGGVATFVVGSAGSFTITATGFPAPALSATGALPAGVTFTDNGSGTATLAGTPTAGAAGSYPITITATNGIGTAAQQGVTITVNQAAAITSAVSTTFAVGNASTFTVTTSGVPAVTSIARTGASLPAGVTFTDNNNGTATLAGTPAAGTAGTYALTFTAANGIGSPAQQNFTLAVNPVGGAQNDSFPGGVGNTQYSVGAGAPATPAVVVAGSVLDNDTGASLPLTAGPASIATANGGQVTMASTGAFLYTPPLGFAGPSDTFTYTRTDNAGATDTAVVTINMSGVVWYVNATAGAGNGQSHSPFNTMPAAAVAAQPGQVIYVHAGSPAGNTALKASQTLWGAGANYTLNGLTIPATAAPALQGTVTLANGVLVSSLSVNGGAGAAFVGSGITGTATLNAVAITGGTTGVSINGGTGTLNIGATIAIAGGRSVDVQNRTGGTVNFLGAISDTGAGIQLIGNTGSAVAFTGGLALSTGANVAFTATGGGTITATQNAPGIVNTIVTTSGTALNVANTTIGGADLTFQSINAGTAAFTAGVGVSIVNTGVAPANGRLIVTGNGTALSGGRIRRKSGPNGSVSAGVGIYLENTRQPSFSWMELTGFDNSAIAARNVAGFQIEHSTITAAGNTGAISEGPVVFGLPISGSNPAGVNGLQTGTTALIRNTIVTGGFEHNIAIHGQSGTTTLRVDRTTAIEGDCEVSTNNDVNGGYGVLAQFEGSAVGSVVVDRCRLRSNRVAGVMARAADAAILNVTVSSSEVSRGLDGLVLTNSGDAEIVGLVTNNTISSFGASGVRLGQVAGTASALSLLQASIIDNRLSSSESSTDATIAGHFSSAVGQISQARILIADNGAQATGAAGVFQQDSPQPGIRITTDAASTPLVNVTVRNNHLDMNDPLTNSSPGRRGGFAVDLQASAGTVCAAVGGATGGNISHWYPTSVTVIGSVATAPSPGASGTSLTLQAGQGAVMPTLPQFYALVWPAGETQTAANSEVVSVTSVTGDTLTMVRAQEGTTARTIVAGDQFRPIGGRIRAQQSLAGLFQLEAGSQTTATPAAAVLQANNSTHPVGPGVTVALGTIGIVANGSCPLPSAP